MYRFAVYNYLLFVAVQLQLVCLSARHQLFSCIRPEWITAAAGLSTVYDQVPVPNNNLPRNRRDVRLPKSPPPFLLHPIS